VRARVCVHENRLADLRVPGLPDDEARHGAAITLTIRIACNPRLTGAFLSFPRVMGRFGLQAP
jgi:hypothetical protein